MNKIKSIIKSWILDFVKKNQGCSIGCIQKELDLNYYAINPVVKELANEGKVILKPMANRYEVYLKENATNQNQTQ